MIADEMFKAQQLSTSVSDGSPFGKMFEDIFKRSKSFTQSINDNGLGFSRYINGLLDENTEKMQRNMRISELVHQYIKEGKIKEKC